MLTTNVGLSDTFCGAFVGVGEALNVDVTSNIICT